jgi:uncharacterized protein YbjQ (UPF0145 family)
VTVGILDIFKGPDAETLAARAAHDARHADILSGLRSGELPVSTRTRLQGARLGSLPWVATLTPAELLVVRSHGMRPIAAVSANCWLHYGYSWTQGHAEGWGTALKRLRDEARAAGANAVLDVKMRTLPVCIGDSMDFTLVGTAVRVEGLSPSSDPVIATVPALEFVKLLEADVVPTGLAIGAQFEWMTDWRGNATRQGWWNIEATQLSYLWERVPWGRACRIACERPRPRPRQRRARPCELQPDLRARNGRKPAQAVPRAAHCGRNHRRCASRYSHSAGHQHVVDLHAGGTPLLGTNPHHQSYSTNDAEEAIQS